MNALFLPQQVTQNVTPPPNSATVWADINGKLWFQLPNQAPVQINAGIVNTGNATAADVTSGKTFSSATLTNAAGSSTKNATVASGAPIEPPQAFVDTMLSFYDNGPNVATFTVQPNKSGYTATFFLQGSGVAIVTWWDGTSDAVTLTSPVGARIDHAADTGSTPRLGTIVGGNITALITSVDGDGDFWDAFNIVGLKASTLCDLSANSASPKSLIASGAPSIDTATLDLVSGITGAMNFANCPALSVVNADSTTGITSYDFTGCIGLTDLNCHDNSSCAVITMGQHPVLETIWFSGNPIQTLDISACPIVTSLQLAGCALTVAAVNAILRNLVAFGLSGGLVDVSGGTSAAPTGQGISDKATLISRGVTVATN